MTDESHSGETLWETTEWYEVKPGDTLPAIAQHYYGDPALYPRIVEANTDMVIDPARLEPGQKLRIP